MRVRGAFSAADNRAAACLRFHVDSRLPARHVADEGAEVCRRQILHRPIAYERHDVPVDTAGIQGKRGRFFRNAAALRDEALPSPIKVFAAQFRDRHRLAVGSTSGGGVVAPKNISEEMARALASLFRGQDAVPTEGQPSAAPIPIAVLKDE